MLNVNRKRSHNVAPTDTTSLGRPELNVKEMLNQQTSGRQKVLIEVMCNSSKERSDKINE